MKHSAPLSSPFRVQTRSTPSSASLTAVPEAAPPELGFPKEKLLLTVPETARYLQVSTTTVRNLIDSGELIAGHVGMSPTAKRLCLRVTRQSMERLQKKRFGFDSKC